MEGNNEDIGKVSFEIALDKADFGLYSYINTICSGVAIISMACLVYGTTIIVPASACELQTTRAQQGLLVAAPVVGLIIGATLWGYLGDTRGRRKMLLVSLLSSAVLNALSSISVNWVMLMLLQFFTALLAAAKYTLSMTLLSECVPMAKRNLVVLMVSSIFLLSQGIMAVLAIPVIPLTFSHYLPALDIYWNSWRSMVVVYSIPSLLCACVLYFLQESPKFVLVRGDERQALEILKTIQRVNLGKKAVFDVPGLLPESSVLTSKLSAKDQIVPLFKTPLVKHTIILALLFMFQLSGSFLAWLPTIANRVIWMYEAGEVEDLTLCGILRADFNMPGDPNATPCALNVTSLLIVLLVGAVQSVLNLFLTIVVVNRAGRRNTGMILAAVAGLGGILVNLIFNTIGTSVLFGLFLMGIIAQGLYTAIAVTIFPTHLRAMAVALTMTAGRITSFAGIQIANYLLGTNCELGFYLFGAIFASSAIVASFLPDDRFLRNPQRPKEQD
ncbi:putative transporter svop-1 [Cydia pomonella]|uniref:putative transporter svop-1 n=1 Tax=Cydia pomonella TaxID=82600 RepID=UPI002ADD96F7|nr:putative transporter svop-1 [Cydia pomonella]